MERKTLYFVRHGESVYNKLNIIQGDVDPPLTKEGKDQAFELGGYLLGFGIKQMAVSPLIRAKQTAEFINTVLNLPVSYYEDLREMYFGDWQGEMKIEHWDPFRRNFYEHGQPPPGGESKKEIIKRGEKCVLQICNDINEQPVLVVSHGMLVRLLIGEWFTNNTEKEIRALRMPNLGVYKVEFEYDKKNLKPRKYEFLDLLGQSPEIKSKVL
ncbi:histidine phosphatase family protein [Candidatus Peregrinibacteria bacterium]|nr:histidine phosphatase family protein [Candidatus Peregrinibacteria bacterium]